MEFEKQVSLYFKANNSLARRIVDEQEYIQKMYSDNWEQMTCEEKESIYNSFAVPASVLEKYSDMSKTNEYPDSFPRHVVACGEKIVVDYNNDCQTWPDEHSGPFSWKTKSQQDLTLLDLEPDQLTKKSEKTRKAPPPAKQVFETKTCPWKRENGGIWDSPFLAAERGMDPVFTNNIIEPNSNTNSEEEEKNTAVQEDKSRADTKVIQNPKQPPPLPSTRPPSITRPPAIRPPPPPIPTTVPRKVDYHTVPLADSHPKKAGRKSNRNSRSEIRASALKNSPNSEVNQNVDHKRDSAKFEPQIAAGTHMSINNPAFTDNDEKGIAKTTTSLDSKGEWSHFIGEKEASSASSTPTKQLLKEPEPMSISRQVEPIPMKNTNFVVDEEESVPYSCNNEESESLLKVNDQFEKANLNAVNTMESEENVGTKRDSNIVRTGFDFLDDW